MRSRRAYQRYLRRVGKTKRKARKVRGRLYKAIKRGCKKAILKYTDTKVCIKRNILNPALANYIASGAPQFCPIDPPLAAATNSVRNSETNTATNLWGYTGTLQGYAGWANAPFIIGNTIKRTSFKVRFNFYANWYQNTIAPYTLLTNNPLAASNIFSSQLVESRFRVSIVRAQSSVDDDALEAYMAALTASLFEDPWNKSYCQVLYDKFFRCSAPGAGRHTYHKTISFRGKRGSQRLNLPITDSNGALVQNYCSHNKLYLVIRIYAYNFVSGGNTYQLLPYFDKVEIVTKYVDI